MGVYGRLLSVLMVFVLVAGALLASWLLWGQSLQASEAVSQRLLQDTVKLALQDSRQELDRLVTADAGFVARCEGLDTVDFCLSSPLESDAPFALFLRKDVIESVSGSDWQASSLRDQLARQQGAGAGVVYWLQQPLWVEYVVQDGELRAAGVVLPRMLDRWSRSMHVGMNWRWRQPGEAGVPAGMAEVSLPAVSGAPLGLLVSASVLNPPLLGSMSGINLVAASVLLTALVWLLVYRPVWRRVDSILLQLRTIMAKRDYSGRVRVAGNQGVAEIAQHCNGLLSALEYSHNLMAKTNLVTSELLHKLERASDSDDPDGQDPWRASMDLAARFPVALQNGELVMHYQPVVAVDTGVLVGWEALCRWHTQDQGMLLPADFLPIVEQSGQMQAFLVWSVAQVIRDLPGLPDGFARVSLNLSHAQLLDPQLVSIIDDGFSRAGLALERLDVEIRETSLLKDFEPAVEQIEALRSIGVGVCVDGYGFGAHSLTYLQRCPVTRLKLSRVFSERISLEPRETAFIEGIARFAAGLGAAVVVTHIETAQQLSALRSCRGLAAQGFALAHPMSLEDARSWRAAAAQA